MLIAIDIGNTNITIGRFDEKSDQVLDYANFKTDKRMTTDDMALKYYQLLRLWESRGEKKLPVHRAVMVSSVVPSLDYSISHLFEKYYEITPVFARTKNLEVKIDYEFPREVGADRIVNALAGERCFPGKNKIIVDFGTATTLDIVSGDGTYQGGVIIPGIMSSLHSLSDSASKLPHIDLSQMPPVVGKNTVDGIRSGILHGNGAMLDELTRRIADEMGWKDYTVISTGGLSELIRKTAKSIDVFDRHLTLKGLYYFWKDKHA